MYMYLLHSSPSLNCIFVYVYIDVLAARRTTDEKSDMVKRAKMRDRRQTEERDQRVIVYRDAPQKDGACDVPFALHRLIMHWCTQTILLLLISVCEEETLFMLNKKCLKSLQDPFAEEWSNRE